MRGGDLSLRPVGLEAKQGAQRAVGDRGQSPGTDAQVPLDGYEAEGDGEGQMAVNGRHSQDQATTESGLQGENVNMYAQTEDGNMEKRAMVGHLKAE